MNFCDKMITKDLSHPPHLKRVDERKKGSRREVMTQKEGNVSAQKPPCSKTISEEAIIAMQDSAVLNRC